MHNMRGSHVTVTCNFVRVRPVQCRHACTLTNSLALLPLSSSSSSSRSHFFFANCCCWHAHHALDLVSHDLRCYILHRLHLLLSTIKTEGHIVPVGNLSFHFFCRIFLCGAVLFGTCMYRKQLHFSVRSRMVRVVDLCLCRPSPCSGLAPHAMLKGSGGGQPDVARVGVSCLYRHPACTVVHSCRY
jgi:hypothetical protein